MDWVAAAMSGLIQCHGFDQAALQLLFLSTLTRANGSKDNAFDDPSPLGFSCLAKYNYPENVTDDWSGKGCDGGSDWTCDGDFEDALVYAGFRITSRNFFGENGVSSWSKGCANSFSTTFHIMHETATVPRLQCFHCGATLTEPRTSYGEGSSLLQGDLGGGNFFLR